MEFSGAIRGPCSFGRLRFCGRAELRARNARQGSEDQRRTGPHGFVTGNSEYPSSDGHVTPICSHFCFASVQDPNWNEIRLEYSRKLLAMFLAGHPNHQLVFMRLWQIEPTYLTDAFRDFYEENNLNITRILDVAQDLKVRFLIAFMKKLPTFRFLDQTLESLLEVRPFVFALDVAALASRREYLNLDKWLADNIQAHGADFLHSVVVFLDQKMESEKICRISDPAIESRTMPLNPQTITIILRTLRNKYVRHIPTWSVVFTINLAPT
jgi:hypothetical protein